MPGSAQEPSYNRTSATEIDDPCMACAERGHDLTHVLDAGCPSFGNDCRYRPLDLGLLELARQEGLDDCDLVAFLLREVGAIALLVKHYRFAALLDHPL